MADKSIFEHQTGSWCDIPHSAYWNAGSWVTVKGFEDQDRAKLRFYNVFMLLIYGSAELS